ncbi:MULTISPECIES: holin [unclassified Kutzneria]|uniref:holin n=1 Tax=unclassified Kutzneria TaxID=2621979 RepID=UPI0004B8FB62|nr:holin [Kutzneria sp. 744]
MFTMTFWQCTLERAMKTFCQTLVAVLGAGSVGLLNAAWTTSLSTAGMAALLSVLTSVGSAPLGKPGSPSLLPPQREATPR